MIHYLPKALREKLVVEHPIFVGVILVAWLILVSVVIWLLVMGP